MKNLIVKIICVVSMFATLVGFAGDNELWAKYEDFANGRWSIPDSGKSMLKREWARKKYFAENFHGKEITLSGIYQKSGKGVMGGTYVSLKVGEIMVKVMARPSETSKIASLTVGSQITFTATFKSRGDAIHSVTFEDGIFATGDSAPIADNTVPVVDEAETRSLWAEYKSFAEDRWNDLDTASSAVNKELVRKRYFSEKFYGKTVKLTGTFKKSGKAVMGGTYLSISVDGVDVKIMMRPSEKSKLSSYSAGDQVTVVGTFKSRGDLVHSVTLESGVLK
jgi:hypothetical protein